MNFVMMLGRLTADPEMRMSQSGTAVTRFCIAVDRRFSKPGEEKQADFFNCVCFKGTAEFVNNHFEKGRKIAITGELQSRKWTDPEGKNRTDISILVNQVEFADSKKKESTGEFPSYQETNQPAQVDNEGFLPIDDPNLPF